MALTNKQQRFVDEYLIDLNSTQAAIRAGYSEKTAYSIGNENLSKPEIKAAIEESQAKTADRLQITKESLIQDLLAIKDLCFTEPKVIHNSIKAIEVINKMLGYNEPDKTDINLNGNINLKDMIEFDDE